MKLTLGQAAKEAGISKPSLSAAIKKGRLSAVKNDAGVYQIDPAELFRVYPRTGEPNSKPNTKALPPPNPKSSADSEGLGLLLAEKDASIRRLEEEKDAIREDLKEQREQAKRVTMLLEDKQKNGAGEWEQSFRALESRMANQEAAARETKEREQKILRQNRALKNALEQERTKTFWQKLFG